MGVEFLQHTASQQARVQQFIQELVNTEGAVPDLQVRPDTIDNSAAALTAERAGNGDPLLSLFHTKAEVPVEVFQIELRKQRGVPQEVAVS